MSMRLSISHRTTQTCSSTNACLKKLQLQMLPSSYSSSYASWHRTWPQKGCTPIIHVHHSLSN